MSVPSNYRPIASTASVIPGGNPFLSAPAPVTYSILKEQLQATSSQSPFFTTSRGHPGFTPQKIGTKRASAAPLPKLPKAPEKPQSPYVHYSCKVWDQVKAQNPALKFWEIARIVRQMWCNLPEKDKQEFLEKYESEKGHYEKTLKLYHSSPAYQAYVTAKCRVQQAAEGHQQVLYQTGGPIKSPEQRIDSQTAEDEDPDDGFSFKHAAHARFTRNHRLINEIFSDEVVPGATSVVTTIQLQALKRQVQSLTLHHKKLDAELQQIEDKFQAKKQKIIESNNVFQDKLKKIRMNVIDKEVFQKMVEKEYEILKCAYEERMLGTTFENNASGTKLESKSPEMPNGEEAVDTKENIEKSADNAYEPHPVMSVESLDMPTADRATATAPAPLSALLVSPPIRAPSSAPVSLLASAPVVVPAVTQSPAPNPTPVRPTEVRVESSPTETQPAPSKPVMAPPTVHVPVLPPPAVYTPAPVPVFSTVPHEQMTVQYQVPSQPPPDPSTYPPQLYQAPGPPLQQQMYMPSQQTGHYPPQQMGHYPTQQTGHYPTQQMGHYPTQQTRHYPTQQTRHYPSQQTGHYPPQQTGEFPPQQMGQYPPQQTGHYPPQQTRQYPPQQTGQYPPQQTGHYPPQHQYYLQQYQYYPQQQQQQTYPSYPQMRPPLHPHNHSRHMMTQEYMPHHPHNQMPQLQRPGMYPSPPTQVPTGPMNAGQEMQMRYLPRGGPSVVRQPTLPIETVTDSMKGSDERMQGAIYYTNV